MGPSDIPRADGRRLEGERDGLDIQGDRCVGYRRGPAMAPTRSGAQGSSLPAQNPKGFFPGQGWIQSPAAVIEKPPAAGAGRQPVNGGRKPSNRLPSRHPRTRRTLAGAAGGAGGVGALPRSNQPKKIVTSVERCNRFSAYP